jgi:hypothetical protein
MVALTTIAVGVAAVGVGASIVAGKKATKQQKKANAAQRKINQLKNKQAKRAFIRNFRQQQAIALTQGIASGVGLESSLVQGTMASQAAQAKTALREFKAFDSLGGEFTAATNRASSAAFKSAAFGQVAAFAGNFISFGGATPPAREGG